MIINPYFFNQPSFYRSFVSFNTLNHGTGPSISFIRGSSGSFFDKNKNITFVSNNIPRFDYNLQTGESLGLLMERPSVNYIGNSLALTANPGLYTDISSIKPNLPLGWNVIGDPSSISSLNFQIVGSGNNNGFVYWDYKIFGNPNKNSNISISPTDRTPGGSFSFPVIPQSVWTASTYIALVSGSTTNAQITLQFTTSGFSGFRPETSYPTDITNIITNGLKRYTHTHTFTAIDNPTQIEYQIRVNYTNNNPIDLTLRVSYPQIENLNYPTSYILTHDSARARASDLAFVTPVSSFYNKDEGTFIAEYSLPYTNNPSDFLFEFANKNDISQNMSLRLNNGILLYQVVNTNLQQTAVGTGLSSTEILKFGGSYRKLPSINYYLKRNGVYNLQPINLPPPSGIDILSFFNDSYDSTTLQLNIMYLRKFTYYKTQLSLPVFNSLV